MPLRSQSRTRFVTFAFAAADLLLETTPSGQVRFAAGAARLFANCEAEELVGRELAELVAEPDRPLVRHLLRRAAGGDRVGPVLVASATKEVTGRLAALADPVCGAVAVTLSDVRAGQRSAPAGPGGLLDRETLQSAIRSYLETSAPGGEAAHLSLFALDGLEGAKESVPEAVVDELTTAIAAALRAAAPDGRAAGELAPGRYAVLHEHAERGRRLEKEVREIVAESELAERVRVERQSVPLAEPTLGLREVSDALAYTLASFARSPEPRTAGSLADALGERFRETVRRVEEVRSTIQQAAFTLVYQPIVRLPGRELHHYEALVRFGERDGPGETIGFAEQVGLVAELDLLVARRVLRELGRARARGSTARVAINLSARSLASDSFVEALARQLQASDLPARCLLFEITESWELSDLPRADAVLGSLRKMGHEVCLDDFGAGAAAFQYIRHLSVDFVKLDGSYTGKLLSSPREASIVASVVGLCRDLGVAVIAEMVETEAQCRRLQDLGVGFGQGWLFGRPSPGIPSERGRLGRRRGVREEWA